MPMWSTVVNRPAGRPVRAGSSGPGSGAVVVTTGILPPPAGARHAGVTGVTPRAAPASPAGPPSYPGRQPDGRGVRAAGPEDPAAGGGGPHWRQHVPLGDRQWRPHPDGPAARLAEGLL